MRERQPDVQRYSARLRGEAERQERPHQGPRAGTERRGGGAPVGEARASRPRRQQQHAGEHACETGVCHDGVHPRRVRGRRGLAPRAGAVEDEDVRSERHQLPREDERHHVRSEGHEGHSADEGRMGHTSAAIAAGVADGVDGRGHRHCADERDEQSGQRVHLELETAQRHQPLDPRRPARAEQAGNAGRRDRGAQQRRQRVDDGGHQRGRPSASRRPASSAAGDGGQPEISASTGTISRTPPTTA